MPKSNKVKKEIYMDFASAAPLDSVVFSEFKQAMLQNFANPGSIHDFGVNAKSKVYEARNKVAKLLGAGAREIIFTSGATEANNLAILGIVRKYKRPHIVTTNIEHASVLEVCKHLVDMKLAEVTYVEVEPNGIVDPKKIKKVLRSDTVLVTVMYANNEIGTIQPIREIAKEIRHFKKFNPQSKIFFHTDAAQAANYLDLNVVRLGVDMMTLGSAKIYGPKGIGMLYKKQNINLEKIIWGGYQEMGIRAGTENTAGIIGFAKALEITEKIKEKESKRLAVLRDHFIKQIHKLDSSIILNGDTENRLPNNVNITIPKFPSDLLVIELSARGIYVSEKSACKSGDKKNSHVISALRKDNLESLRFSLGRSTTRGDIDFSFKVLKEVLAKLSPWYK